MSTQNNLEQKKKEIEEIYQKYLKKLKELKLEQGDIAVDFIKQLEAKKLEEHKKDLNI